MAHDVRDRQSVALGHNRPVPSPALGFSQLIAPLTIDEFFATYFEQRCLHLTGDDPARFASVLDLDRIERLLWEQAGRLDEFVAVLQDGARQMAPRAGAFKWAEDLFNSGASLVLDDIGNYELDFARFQQRVRQELGTIDLSTNVYLTPASRQTFPVHFDVHDTFVIHLHGTKRWRTYARVVELPMAHHSRKLDLAKLGPVVDEIDLAPGHILYIPRGVPHWAVAAGEPSLHVTLGFYPMRYVDLLRNLLHVAADAHPELRAAVPRTLDVAALTPMIQRLATSNVGAAVDRWHEHAIARAPALPDAGLIGTFAGAEPLAIDDWVERCRGLQTHVSTPGDRARIAFGGYLPFPNAPDPASMQGPDVLRGVFEFVASSQAPFRVRDVPGELTDQAKVLVVGQLVGQGLLRRTAAP